MAKILITSEFFCKFDSLARDILTNAGHTVIDNPYGHKFLSPEEIIRYSHDADAFICDLEKINKDVINASPSLKIVSRRGVGVDSVDTAYCAEKGIEVARTLGIVERPVAELVMAYILQFSRRVATLSSDMQSGIWEKKECHSVDGKTLGIVGMGRVAYEVARRASAFGMKIIYCDVAENEKAKKDFGAVRADLETVLANADFVSLHTPLTEKTRGMFNYETLCKMKKSAYIINTSRGAVINSDDLKKTLSENLIKGAAIDVFDVEPETESPLKGMENVILTPHVGTFTQEIFIGMDRAAAQNVVDFFNGKGKQ